MSKDELIVYDKFLANHINHWASSRLPGEYAIAIMTAIQARISLHTFIKEHDVVSDRPSPIPMPSEGSPIKCGN